MDKELQLLGRLLRKSKRVLFITGAGVSVESGIPTFRGRTGAFANGLTEDGMPLEEALSGPTFRRNPELSWKYFRDLELALRGKQPNPAHYAIAGLESRERAVWVATQNIDGLHQSAGSASVIELHGNLRRIVCTRCNYQAYLETFEGLSAVPRCPNCAGILRPDAVLYEEMLPEEALGQYERQTTLGFDLVFSVGTTSIFEYVIQPIVAAIQRQIPTVEINPDSTPISDFVQFRFATAAGSLLPALQELVR